MLPEGGYLLHSPSPYRLWFQFDLSSGVKHPIHESKIPVPSLPS